jgi:hypothetical protein
MASVLALAARVGGAGAASADTHTGFQLVLHCGATTYTVVTPTGPAAASQDIDTTKVLVLSYADLVSSSGNLPENQLMTCTFTSPSGTTYTLSFLIAPTKH